MFEIDEAALKELSGLALTDREAWIKFVLQNRVHMKPLGHGFDFIEGAFVANTRNLKFGVAPIPSGQQTVFFTRKAAELLDSGFSGIIK